MTLCRDLNYFDALVQKFASFFSFLAICDVAKLICFRAFAPIACLLQKIAPGFDGVQGVNISKVDQRVAKKFCLIYDVTGGSMV